MQNNGQGAPISIPILKVQDCLIASIQVSLDDRAVFGLRYPEHHDRSITRNAKAPQPGDIQVIHLHPLGSRPQ